METDTISKNGASLKRQMNRTRFSSYFILIAFSVSLAFVACDKDEKEYIVDLTYHCEGSEDVMSAYDITVMYYTEAGARVQETVQLPWQKTIKGFSLPVLNKIEWVGVPKQNYPQKDSYNLDIDVYVTYTGVKGNQSQHQPYHFTTNNPALTEIKGECLYSIYRTCKK